LVAAAIEWAQLQRADKIGLAVAESNAHAAALYRRHLFVDIGAIDYAGSGVASERHMLLDLSNDSFYVDAKRPARD
jgi:ribosomal protein S18 acetylase RimI-like enzyme